MTRCATCRGAGRVHPFPGGSDAYPCPCTEQPRVGDPYACLTDAELEREIGRLGLVRERYAALVGLLPESDLPHVPEGLREPARELARRRAGDDLAGGVL